MKSSSVNQKGIPFLATVKPVYPLANLLSVKNTTNLLVSTLPRQAF